MPTTFADIRSMLERKQGFRAAFLGDSISEIDRQPGWFGGASRRAAHYGEIFRQKVAEAHGYEAVMTVYAGHGGQNTYQALGRMTYQLGHVRPELLIVALGANDFAFRPLTAQESAFALDKIFDESWSLGSPAIIVISASHSLATPDYDSRIDLQRDVCAKRGVPFVDLRMELRRLLGDGRKWTEFFPSEDNCHPNDAGHALWGECLWKTFTEAVSC